MSLRYRRENNLSKYHGALRRDNLFRDVSLCFSYQVKTFENRLICNRLHLRTRRRRVLNLVTIDTQVFSINCESQSFQNRGHES